MRNGRRAGLHHHKLARLEVRSHLFFLLTSCALVLLRRRRGDVYVAALSFLLLLGCAAFGAATLLIRRTAL